MSTSPAALLFNPNTYDPQHFDPETRRLLRATIDWFEERGKVNLLSDYIGHVWYADFLEFQAREGLFATFLTPAAAAAGNADRRWDTARIAALSEVLGFYGLGYWYTWQVTILGLGPVWQSENASVRARVAQVLADGGVGAFGLSEREHGADIYSTDLLLTPDGSGGYLANGSKYYIGNGNVAGIVSVFGRRTDVEGADGYVFFAADSRHPNYHLIQNVVPSQMFVSEFRLEDYPVSSADLMQVGEPAFYAALNTVNIGKFNLCFGGIGIAEHSLYEAITHAHNRILYGNPVTVFPHIRRYFVDAYVRLTAMKLFSDRAIDYFRSANPDDRRYLLFNPITKMKVTTEAEKVVALLADVVAAKAFEKDQYLTIASNDVRGLPKLEGTVAVNLALINKFMPAYLFQPQDYPPVPTRTDAVDDDFLFRQGPARGLANVRFHDWRQAYARSAGVPNVDVFTGQAEGFAALLATASPTPEQLLDQDFTLALGELFTLIVYGQLVLEQAEIVGLDGAVLDEIFSVLVRDFSAFTVNLHGKAATTIEQRDRALGLVKAPIADGDRFDRIWQQVVGLAGVYEMKP
jgi:acyl-CoA dehydrogenase